MCSSRSHPAAIADITVVSEMGEQWSPNRQPDSTAPIVMGMDTPKPTAILMPIGSRIAMAPHEVPVAKEIMTPTRNSRAGTTCGVISPSVESTIN